MTTTLSVSVRRGGPSARPGESLIVVLDGELDIATAPQFAARFDEWVCDGLRRIVIDVGELTFIDATGLRALTTLRSRAEERLIMVRLSGASAQMRRLMRIIGPARDFPSSGWSRLLIRRISSCLPYSPDMHLQEDRASFTASSATEVSAYSLNASTRFWAPFLTFCCCMNSIFADGRSRLTE